MKTTKGYRLKPTTHFLRQALEKGFDGESIKAAFSSPEEVYPSGSHEGQWRVTGQGLCLVGRFEGSFFVAITIYADRVLTAPRADQLQTEEGRRYAERYANGLGRG